MPAIETEGLRRAFGSLVAVAGVDLVVEQGEVYGFLGPNGAGKTTTVRMLVTLLQPTGGTARVAGFDVVRQANAVRHAIGVALQEAALDPLMTGRELIRLQATLQGLPAEVGRERGDQLLEWLGLVEAADRRVGTYSVGMRRRLDLAMALVHDPEVLFLDEPTTGLDPVSRLALWDEVRRLSSEGTTVFLTTQYLEEADQLADRVGIISEGALVAEGTPEALKTQVGEPHLEVSLLDGQDDGAHRRAEDVLGRFGALVPTTPAVDGAPETELSVRLPGGATEVAGVVRALDEAGLQVARLDLVPPTLDDVFVEKTGQHLEGAGEEDEN